MLSLATANVQKPSNFSRIFTKEDEVKILQAVDAIQQDYPIPSKAADIIFNDIQDEISAQVNITQLGEKIRKLRDRYCKEMNVAELNSHQKQLSFLCKKIWGFKNTQVKKKMFKDEYMENMKDDDFAKNYPFLMKEVSMASKNFVSIDTLKYLNVSMLKQLNECWKKQHLMEAQHFIDQLDLAKEYLKLVLDAFASSSKGKAVVDDEEAMAVDDADDENEQSEDVDEEAEVEVKTGDDDDENEKSEDVDDEEEAEVEVKAGDDDDENEQSEDVDDEEEADDE